MSNIIDFLDLKVENTPLTPSGRDAIRDANDRIEKLRKSISGQRAKV